MKTLQQFINESINESFRNLKVYTPDKMTPPTISKEWPTKDIYSQESYKFDIFKSYWLHGEITGGTGNIALIQWTDDDISGINTKVNDKNQLKREFIKAADEWIKENEEYFEDGNVEIGILIPCGIYYDDIWEEDKAPTSEQLWNKWLDRINRSGKTDEDSEIMISLVDLKQKKVIAGYDVIFDF